MWEIGEEVKGVSSVVFENDVSRYEAGAERVGAESSERRAQQQSSTNGWRWHSCSSHCKGRVGGSHMAFRSVRMSSPGTTGQISGCTTLSCKSSR